MVTQQVSKFLSSIFGSRNDRQLKQYRKRVEQVSAFEPAMRKLTDAQLREKTAEFNRRHVDDNVEVADMLTEIMAVAREAMDRAVGIRTVFNPQHAAQFERDKLSPDMQALYDQLKAQADATAPQPVLGGFPAPAHLLIDVPPAFYEAVRAIYPESRPPFRARPFDVQIIGGMVLSEGKISEMKTGEGKTIVAPLACYAASIQGWQCHVVTVNDYLVQRDRDWTFPFFYLLGLNVGAIHPHHQQPPELKQQAYLCNVVYGTCSEFGFDYLRDNMKLTPQEQFQKFRDFAIVDEIDSILIDEARTPLIISGPARQDAPRYDMADQIARHLVTRQRDWDAADHKVKQAELRLKGLEGDIRNAREKSKIPAMKQEMDALRKQLPELEKDRDRFTQYYEVEAEKKQATLTHEGISEAQKMAGIGSFYVGANIDFPHLLSNAIRAHTVYKRDQQYVVQNGEVVIVDEFTGRLMVGRQWSDGLHQAVEAKEKVKIKEETQTLATITIQNLFKLYKQLAGMTGTAITEATEFHEFYKLDVVSIPTNRAIQRRDREDLIFLSQKDKWNAIIDEIKRVHDRGRPVLVGTTSVEKSEMLAEMLKKRHGIRHEVLNARAEHAEREGHIVESAGQLGAVMIATNMAGRGTDIKLGRVEREAILHHWQQRNILPREAEVSMSDDQLIALSYRHQATRELNMNKREADALSDVDLKLRLLRHWCEKDAYVEKNKADAMTLDDCMSALDGLADYARHRLAVYTHVEEMGGLHIIGTERHESRRIDNQLRGRAGRQGDKGSSRFFISLEDDLMQMFAGDRTKMILSKLGMKEGDAIEHGMVSRSVERAQRKVEERNYEVRKNLLDYDEVMEYQRNDFYGLRQDVLEGKNIPETIFDYLDQAIQDACGRYLARDYVKQQVADWCIQTHDISIDPAKVDAEDLDELTRLVRQSATHETQQIISVTLGEYMSNDIAPEDWDLKGLRDWAMSKFKVPLDVQTLRQSNPDQVRHSLTDAAVAQIEEIDLAGLAKFVDADMGRKDLIDWADNKFGLKITVDELRDLTIDQAHETILGKARELYKQREVRYPVEIMIEVLMQSAQQDMNWAISQLVGYCKLRYDRELQPEEVIGKTGQDLFQLLLDENTQWMKPGGKLEPCARKIAEQHRGDREALKKTVGERFGLLVTDDELDRCDKQGGEALVQLITAKGFESFRSELTRLERFVLLQIIDQAWKDHLYTMDQLKDSIGLRGYAERDPRIEYKREGANLFKDMQSNVRDRVTELAFRARLTPNVQVRNAYGDQQRAVQPVAAASPAIGSEEQERDLAAAEEAGGPGTVAMSRKQRRAAEAQQRSKGGRDE